VLFRLWSDVYKVRIIFHGGNVVRTNVKFFSRSASTGEAGPVSYSGNPSSNQGLTFVSYSPRKGDALRKVLLVTSGYSVRIRFIFFSQLKWVVGEGRVFQLRTARCPSICRRAESEMCHKRARTVAVHKKGRRRPEKASVVNSIEEDHLSRKKGWPEDGAKRNGVKARGKSSKEKTETAKSDSAQERWTEGETAITIKKKRMFSKGGRPAKVRA